MSVKQSSGVSFQSESLLFVPEQSIHNEMYIDSSCKYSFERFADLTGDESGRNGKLSSYLFLFGWRLKTTRDSVHDNI